MVCLVTELTTALHFAYKANCTWNCMTFTWILILVERGDQSYMGEDGGVEFRKHRDHCRFPRANILPIRRTVLATRTPKSPARPHSERRVLANKPGR